MQIFRSPEKVVRDAGYKAERENEQEVTKHDIRSDPQCPIFYVKEERHRKEAELNKPKTKEELLAALLTRRGPRH